MRVFAPSIITSHLVEFPVPNIVTANKRSLGQGNVFTGVCLSVGGGGCLSSMHHRSHNRGVLHLGGLPPGGLPPGGGLHLGADANPPGGRPPRGRPPRSRPPWRHPRRGPASRRWELDRLSQICLQGDFGRSP